MARVISLDLLLARSAWEVGRWRQRIGTAGTAAALLAVATITLSAIELWLAWDSADAAALLAERAARQTVRNADEIAGTLEAQLDAFYAQLAAHDSIPDIVESIIATAASHELSLKEGEYRPQSEGVGGFFKYRMTLPVEGAAPAVQDFVLDVLRQHRSLALESVTFRRERIGSEHLEAKVNFTLMTSLPERAAGPRP